MEILNYVMTMEKEGEALYRGFAEKVQEPGMAKIFLWLAEQEKRHYETFEKMKEGKIPVASEDRVFQQMKDIFENWKKQMPILKNSAAQVALYQEALVTEQQSAALYKEQAAKVSSDEEKSLWLQIAGEEERHEMILENIIDMITKPSVWAENAEFSHLDEDYYN